MRLPITEQPAPHRAVAETRFLRQNNDMAVIEQLSLLTLGINIDANGSAPERWLLASREGPPRDHPSRPPLLPTNDRHHERPAGSKDEAQSPTPKASENQPSKSLPENRRDESSIYRGATVKGPFLSREARQFWSWSIEFQNWYHVDDETGSLIWAPLDFD